MEQTPIDTSHKPLARRLFAPIAALAIALFVLLVWHLASQSEQSQTPGFEAPISTLARSGDHEAAVSEYVASQNNARSADERAYAAINVFGSLYKASGRIEDVIAGVRELKEIFKDPSLSKDAQSRIVMTLANAYSETARSSPVYREVYADEPFKSLRGESRSLSLQNMLMWANEIFPNSQAEVGIASSYMLFELSRPYVAGRAGTPEDTKEAIAQAKVHLKAAEELLTLELEQDPRLVETTRFASQGFWRAVTIGSGAYLGDSEFTALYRDKYDSFIKFISERGSVDAQEYLPAARLRYAIVLSEKGDETAAREQILQLIEFVNANPNKMRSEFVMAIPNIYELSPEAGPSYLSTWIQHFTSSIPEFKVFVDSVLQHS